MFNRKVHGESGRNLRLFSRNFSGGTQENSVRIAGFRAEILTQDLPNKIQQINVVWYIVAATMD
jgi:hypothetical protein